MNNLSALSLFYALRPGERITIRRRRQQKEPQIDALLDLLRVHFPSHIVDEVMTRVRSDRAVTVRYIAMYVLRRQGFSLPQIGRQLVRNHATVIHACQKMEKQMAARPQFGEFIEVLIKVFNAQLAREVTVEHGQD